MFTTSVNESFKIKNTEKENIEGLGILTRGLATLGNAYRCVAKVAIYAARAPASIRVSDVSSILECR